MKLVWVSAVAFAATQTWAAPGDLDPTFGVNNPWMIKTPIGSGDSYGRAVVVQPDGKVVIAGYAEGSPGFALVRYTPTGSLDDSFGSGGKVTTAFGDDAEPLALVIQPDGKLVAAGSVDEGFSRAFALVRYNADGTLDTTFGSGGKVSTSFAPYRAQAHALVLQPDGKLVAAGRRLSGGGFVLVRYHADGALDLSFGSGGKVLTHFVYSANALALALQADGKLVAAGAADGNFALARYNADGTLDTGFGTDGKIITSFSEYAWAYAVAVQADGKIVAAGSFYDLSFAVVRYNANGSLDSSFGTGGIVDTSIGTFSGAAAIVVQSDQKLVVSGWTSSAISTGFALVRYAANGALDTSFGTAGKVTTTLPGDYNSESYALALLPDGKLVAAGYTEGSDYAFALVRYTAAGAVDIGLNPGTVRKADLWAAGLVQQADGKLVVAGGQVSAPMASLSRYLPDGSTDTSFGSGGVVTIDFGSPTYQHFFDVTQQSDGKLVAVGLAGNPSSNFIAARYFPNGLLDGTFGSGGKVVTDFGGDDSAETVLTQADGKVVAVGCTCNYPNCDFALARYAANGALDSSFGGTGKVTTNFATFGCATSGVLQPDGKIVAVGIGGPPSTPAIAIARYNPDGSLDSSFGGGTGKATYAVFTSHWNTDLALEPDGRMTIFASGYDSGSDLSYAMLLRLHSDGTLDSSFGTGGVALGPVGEFVTVVRERSGKLVVAGTVGDGNGQHAVARFRSDGTLDPTFGSGGMMTVPGVEGEVFTNLVVQADGKLVVAGDDYGIDGMAISRLQASYCHEPDPASICAAAGKSQLQWQRGANPAKQKLAFKWTKGDATGIGELADPLTTAAYSLCIADDDGTVMLATLPPGGTCSGKPCWKGKAKGYGFKDKSAGNSGIFNLNANAGAAGKSKVLAKGKGANLPNAGSQPLDGTVTAMVVNEDTGFCAAATFSGPQISTNDGVSFKAKAP